MAGASLLALLDDIASVLDDVALMTKVAAKKSAGVLGDDLALNAQQVSGVVAERELPVVWAVAKGSFVNKLILIPTALLISVFAPFLITPLLMVGGAYLCYEGAEKLLHSFLHSPDEDGESEKEEAALQDDVDLVALEKEKIKGAVRTDFVLSAEIIVIALGAVPEGSSLLVRSAVISLIGIIMTVGVYGLVAGIVKLDDAGFFLVRKNREGTTAHKLGTVLVGAAPPLMRLLGVVGTVAMFMVGGGILAHGMPFFHHITDALASLPLSSVLEALANAAAGVLAGSALVLVVTGASKAFGKKEA